MSSIGITLLTLLVSALSTITGFGTSALMVPILLLFFPLFDTLLLVGIIHFVSELFKVLLFKDGIRWKLIVAFTLPGVLATFIGAQLSMTINGALFARILGTMLIGYAIYTTRYPAHKTKHKKTTAIVGGLLSGFTAGSVGVGGPVRSAFLASYDLPKHMYIASTGVISLFVDTIRIAAYIQSGAELTTQVSESLLLIVGASLIGTYVAKHFAHLIPQTMFRQMILVFLLLIGIKYMLFPL